MIHLIRQRSLWGKFPQFSGSLTDLSALQAKQHDLHSKGVLWRRLFVRRLRAMSNESLLVVSWCCCSSRKHLLQGLTTRCERQRRYGNTSKWLSKRKAQSLGPDKVVHNRGMIGPDPAENGAGGAAPQQMSCAERPFRIAVWSTLAMCYLQGLKGDCLRWMFGWEHH